MRFTVLSVTSLVGAATCASAYDNVNLKTKAERLAKMEKRAEMLQANGKLRGGLKGYFDLKDPSTFKKFTRVQPRTQTCDPMSTDPDMGILSCRVGYDCVESDESETGGICEWQLHTEPVEFEESEEDNRRLEDIDRHNELYNPTFDDCRYLLPCEIYLMYQYCYNCEGSFEPYCMVGYYYDAFCFRWSQVDAPAAGTCGEEELEEAAEAISPLLQNFQHHCPEDIELVGQMGDLDYPSLPITIVEQDVNTVKFKVHNPFETTLETKPTIYTRFHEGEGDESTCLKDTHDTTILEGQVFTAECMHSAPVTLVHIFMSADQFTHAVDVPDCCHADNPATPTIQFSFEIACESKCEPATARLLETKTHGMFDFLNPFK